MGSFLADRWNEKPTPPETVTVEEFSEHGLGDKLKREKKKPDHSAENEVKRLNKRLESIDAPFYAVCKDDGTIGYRKVKPSCDPKHPNVTYSRKKVVDAVLKEEEKESKKDAKPAEKPSEKHDKPEQQQSKSSGKIKLKHIEVVWAEGPLKISNKFPKKYKTWESANKDMIELYDAKIKSGDHPETYYKVKFIVTWEDGQEITSRLDIGASEWDDNPSTTTNIFGLSLRNDDLSTRELEKTHDFGNIEKVKPAEKPSEKHDKPEPKKTDADDRDAKSAKILEMIEAKFNKILESKG